jgi:hypothetical protein
LLAAAVVDVEVVEVEQEDFVLPQIKLVGVEV